MSDEEAFSHAARLGGLRSLVIDRFIATQAAINVTGPPRGKDEIEDFVHHFVRWLKDADDAPDRELRRRTLLMVTNGRQGWPDNPAKLARLVDDVYRNIA
jgi:hypothetical protein